MTKPCPRLLPSGTAIRAQPAEPAASADTAIRAQPAEPAASADTAIRAQPAEPAASGDTAIRAQPAEPAASGDTAIRAQPAEPAASGYRARPMRIGVLTGGGDCPGLNAVIRAIVRKGIDGYGHAIVGFRDGWRGPLENAYEELTIESTRGILPRGGTILRSSRTNPLKDERGPERIRENLTTLNLDGLIAIGGEDTLGAAARLHSEHGLPILGVPKTIDNDLGGTDMTFGFDTAVQIATEAIDRLHTTAESHNRVMIVEVMGRHAGWIALHSGLAGGADVILIPERPFDVDEVCRLIRRRHSRGRFFSIVVVAEGAIAVEGTMETLTAAKDEFGHERLGGIGQRLEHEIARRTGFEARATVLGHIQRGGTPTAFDRVLATRLGLAAMDGANAGRWGTMPALRGTRIELVPLSEAVADLRLVPAEDYEAAETFFG